MWTLEIKYGNNCAIGFHFINFEECYWWFRNTTFSYENISEVKMFYKEVEE